jgi:PPM family protein phosphatase
MTDLTPSAAASNSQIQLRLFGRTDVGQVREHNEDNFLIADLSLRSRDMREAARNPSVGRRGNVFAVCDGMGGAAAGEVASQMAVDLIFESLANAPDPIDHNDLARQVIWAVEQAGQHIYEEARSDRSRRGMGTTATVAALMDGRLFLAQVGDSRAYLLRQERLVQVTRDQSLVNQLLQYYPSSAGHLGKRASRSHLRRFARRGRVTALFRRSLRNDQRPGNLQRPFADP